MFLFNLAPSEINLFKEQITILFEFALSNFKEETTTEESDYYKLLYSLTDLIIKVLIY